VSKIANPNLVLVKELSRVPRFVGLGFMEADLIKRCYKKTLKCTNSTASINNQKKGPERRNGQKRRENGSLGWYNDFGCINALHFFFFFFEGLKRDLLKKKKKKIKKGYSEDK
jgi:hypothetical protein